MNEYKRNYVGDEFSLPRLSLVETTLSITSFSSLLRLWGQQREGRKKLTATKKLCFKPFRQQFRLVFGVVIPNAVRVSKQTEPLLCNAGDTDICRENCGGQNGQMRKKVARTGYVMKVDRVGGCRSCDVIVTTFQFLSKNRL